MPGVVERPAAHKTDHRHSRLLRARAERPRRRSAQPRDESSPFHSITSSARLSRAGEMAVPTDFAVLRFIASSNLTGCSTGRSPGLAPFKILATYPADCRYMSGKLGP